MEEQLSPSFEFFIAKGQSKIDITETASGWEVGGSVSAGVKGVEVGINGKYWQSKKHIKGTSESKLKGRHLWLFHIGQLYLHRMAYLRITYEYHYEVCDDGSTNNWVETKYEDNWYYKYEWREKLVIASRDSEGNFHEVDSFPGKSETVKEDQITYEADDLTKESFDQPKNWDFFPEVQ